MHYIYTKPICWEFVLYEFFIVIIGRYAAVYCSYYIFICCPGGPAAKLTFN